MILKSLSRKGNAGAFAQLYDYISEKAHEDRIWHNFLSNQPCRERTIAGFTDNARHIKHSSRHNICYHEILSIQRGAKDQEQSRIAALRDISQKYLARRAKGQLAYAALHLDQSETIHMHMLISANDIGSKRRVRIPKHEFLQIQKELETELQREYPELEERTIYNKPWELSRNLSDKEENLKKRTQQPSKKQELAELLEGVFTSSQSKEDAQSILQEHGVELVERGKSIVAVQDKLRCRLKTLGVEDAYQQIGEKQREPESRADDLERIFREKKGEGRERER